MTFGEKLQELRRRGAMSQDVLAERLGVSRQAVSKWERDEAVPETDKIVRIARIFGVSTDYLLLNEEQEPPRQSQSEYQPRYQFAAINGDRIERFIRRHGYKAGYIMAGAGAFICILALLLWQVYPRIGMSMTGAMTDSFLEMSGSMSGGIIIEGNADIPQDVLEQIVGDQYSSGYQDPFTQGLQQMDQMTERALWAQSGMFLILLFPGGLLLAAGIVIIVKGKKIAAEAL